VKSAVNVLGVIMQNKPNFLQYQMNITFYLTNYYGNFHLLERCKNKANSNPIQTQSKPNQTQNRANQTQNKPNLNLIKPNLKNAKNPYFEK